MIHFNGINWMMYEGALIPVSAPHVPINLSEWDRKYLLHQSGAYLLRWTSHWDGGRPTAFWHIIKEQFMKLEAYASNTRRDIRRGLRKSSVRRVDVRLVRDQGYEVYQQAFLRYDTYLKPVPEVEFKQGILSLPSGTDYWGVFAGDKLVAYAICTERDGACEYGAIKLHPEYLRDCITYALIHTLNDYYLRQRGVAYVTNGARNLSHATRFNELLVEKFLFRKAYCELHVAYAWWLGLPVRLLFPFRAIVFRRQHNVFRKLAVLLRHEEIRRTFGSGGQTSAAPEVSEGAARVVNVKLWAGGRKASPEPVDSNHG